MSDTIKVQELRVSAFVDEIEDVFGASADFTTFDVRLLWRLKQASTERAVVHLKCGPLEVEGLVGKFTWGWRGTRVTIAVDDLRLVKAETPQLSLKERVADRFRQKD